MEEWLWQGMIRRKPLIKSGRRLTMTGWQRYWIELWGSSLVYYSPKTITKSSDRKDYKVTSSHAQTRQCAMHNEMLNNSPNTVVFHVSIWFWKLWYPNKGQNSKSSLNEPFAGVFKLLSQISTILKPFLRFWPIIAAIYLINLRT